MVYEGSMNAQVLIRFLKRLIKNSGRKLFVILDNLRVHHAKIVQEWLEEHREEIELFYLPSYSPELNPDELLNCDLKAGVHSKPPAHHQQQLKGKIVSHMFMLQKTPQSAEILQSQQDKVCRLMAYVDVAGSFLSKTRICDELKIVLSVDCVESD